MAADSTDDDFEKHFAENYNTKLSADDERRFANWLDAGSARRGRDISKDMAEYDMKGYWLNGGYADVSGKGHMPDTYKKPNHPTFSDQSKYHDTPDPWGGKFEGGQWSKDGKSYTPSAAMLRDTHSLDMLQRYMKDVEPGVKLNMDK